MDDTGWHRATADGGAGADDADTFETAPQVAVTAQESALALTAGSAGVDHPSHPHHHEGAPSTHAPSAGHHVADAHATGLPGHHVEPARRRPLVLVAAITVAVLVLVAVAALALGRAASVAAPGPAGVNGSGDADDPLPGLTPGASRAPDATSTDTAAMLPPAQPTLVLGDSLGLVVYPWLADALPDRYVSYEAEVGRSTPATSKALDELSGVPPVVIVSSGTNDGAAAVVEQYARKILDRIGAQRCVVWVDVVRPPTVGDTQEAVNAAIDRATAGRPNVRILRWSEMAAAHPEWLGGDGIHPTDAGAQARSQAMAAASAACSPIDPAAPPAQRQVLPSSIFWGPVSSQYRPPSTSTPTSPTTSASPSRSSATASASASTSASGSGTDPAPPASSSSSASTPAESTTPAATSEPASVSPAPASVAPTSS